MIRSWWGIVSRDIKLSLWRSESLALSLTFGILVVLTFAMTAGPETLGDETVAGVTWSAFVFAGIVNLTGSFRRERANAGMDLMKMAGMPAELIYLAKLVSGFVGLAVCNLVIGLAGGILLGMEVGLAPFLQLSAIAALGTLAICAVGSLVAAISSELKGGESLLVALLLPLLLPVIIASARSFTSVLAGEGMSSRWLLFGLIYTATFLAVSILLFEKVIE